MQASLGATHCQLLRINTRPPAVASSLPATNMEAFWQTHLRGKLPGCTSDDQHHALILEAAAAYAGRQIAVHVLQAPCAGRNKQLLAAQVTNLCL